MEPHEIADEVVKAAQAYDLAHRPYGFWSCVPEHQVRRLLAGADEYLSQFLIQGLPAEGGKHGQ